MLGRRDVLELRPSLHYKDAWLAASRLRHPTSWVSPSTSRRVWSTDHGTNDEWYPPPPPGIRPPGISELVSTLHERGVVVYLVSGGFRQVREGESKNDEIERTRYRQTDRQTGRERERERMSRLKRCISIVGVHWAHRPTIRFLRRAAGFYSLMPRLPSSDTVFCNFSSNFTCCCSAVVAQMIEPVADQLSIPRGNIFANRLLFSDGSSNDGDGATTGGKYLGFSTTEPTSECGGKPKVVGL